MTFVAAHEEKIMIALEELYARVPAIECRGKCQNSCGPIDASYAERERIFALGVEIPRFSGERAQAWAEHKRVMPDGSSLVCPAIGIFGQCRVYEARPLICRVWGVAESMPCEHGCRPRRYLTDAEALGMIMEANRIGGSPFAGIEDTIMEIYRHPEVAPVVARFMRGENVRDELLQVLTRVARPV